MRLTVATTRSEPLDAVPSQCLKNVNQHSSAELKIALFRSLFRGRNDVYPRRFESRKTGRAGYQPACGNEWVRGICEKPRIKCSECPHQAFLPVTEESVRWHLSGKDKGGYPFVMGVYPMLLDETVYFLAMDLDKGGWREDAAALLQSCRRLGIDAALERSRSGNGAHLWLFFEEAISAKLARSLGSHLLTETMEHRPDLGLDSYDRLFPNLLPVSAMPGWPQEVPLPVDPEWKKDYAASVRRLIRDGVDGPLATLFVNAARHPSPDAEGVARARSAREAFFYRRLESLPATAGRFRLNVQLPIPFEQNGNMEVDFLDTDARWVIELDGAQHLGDADAYRRDRRKDALLQENGYFVLRFLAEDLAKNLSVVLDTVLRTLANRDKR